MILDYNKKTGQIYGVIEGRVHDDKIINNTSLMISGVDKDDMGRYVVPLKPIIETIEEPILELRVVDPDTSRVEEVQVGVKKIDKVKELIPDVPFSDLISKFESHEEDIYQYKLELDDKGSVTDIVKRPI